MWQAGGGDMGGNMQHAGTTMAPGAGSPTPSLDSPEQQAGLQHSHPPSPHTYPGGQINGGGSSSVSSTTLTGILDRCMGAERVAFPLGFSTRVAFEGVTGKLGFMDAGTRLPLPAFQLEAMIVDEGLTVSVSIAPDLIQQLLGATALPVSGHTGCHLSCSLESRSPSSASYKSHQMCRHHRSYHFDEDEMSCPPQERLHRMEWFPSHCPMRIGDHLAGVVRACVVTGVHKVNDI